MESLDVHARVRGRWGEMRRIVQRDTAFKRERRGRILKRHFLMAAILAGIAIVVLTGLFVGGGEGPQDTTEGDTVTIEADMDYGDCANASVVIVPEGRVDVIKEYAKQLVDDGKLLYIQDVA